MTAPKTVLAAIRKEVNAAKTEASERAAAQRVLIEYGHVHPPEVEEVSEGRYGTAASRTVRVYTWETEWGTLVLTNGPTTEAEIKYVTKDDWDKAEAKKGYVQSHVPPKKTLARLLGPLERLTQAAAAREARAVAEAAPVSIAAEWAEEEEGAPPGGWTPADLVPAPQGPPPTSIAPVDERAAAEAAQRRDAQRKAEIADAKRREAQRQAPAPALQAPAPALQGQPVALRSIRVPTYLTTAKAADIELALDTALDADIKAANQAGLASLPIYAYADEIRAKIDAAKQRNEQALQSATGPYKGEGPPPESIAPVAAEAVAAPAERPAPVPTPAAAPAAPAAVPEMTPEMQAAFMRLMERAMEPVKNPKKATVGPIRRWFDWVMAREKFTLQGYWWQILVKTSGGRLLGFLNKTEYRKDWHKPEDRTNQEHTWNWVSAQPLPDESTWAELDYTYIYTHGYPGATYAQDTRPGGRDQVVPEWVMKQQIEPELERHGAVAERYEYPTSRAKTLAYVDTTMLPSAKSVGQIRSNTAR
jgi:hypothetical protein